MSSSKLCPLCGTDHAWADPSEICSPDNIARHRQTQINAIELWLRSPQEPESRLRAIQRVLRDPDYAVMIANG